MNFGPDMGGPLIAKEGDDENPGWIEEAGVSAEQLAGVRHVADRFGEDDGVEALVKLQLLHIGDEVANAVIGERLGASDGDGGEIDADETLIIAGGEATLEEGLTATDLEPRAGVGVAAEQINAGVEAGNFERQLEELPATAGVLVIPQSGAIAENFTVEPGAE